MTSEYRHIPVLLGECVEALDVHGAETCLDCTLGGAGHSIELARRLSAEGMLIGLDQDDRALEAARELFARESPEARIVLLKGNFSQLDELLVQARVPGVDTALFDLGVSSPQLDVAQRGFSYRFDAPLDMRMDPSNQTTNAADVLNTYSEDELRRVLRRGGEERWAARIAHAVCAAREKAPLETTFQFRDIVKRAIPAKARRRGGHPAKCSFQAVRIEVNDELGCLERGLEAAIRWLNPGGRIAVIAYHSLEDRLVKETFRNAENACTCPPELAVCVCGNVPVLEVKTRKPILASTEERERNPRSHSARLRVAVKR